MKKIHITESQLKELKKRINENTIVYANPNGNNNSNDVAKNAKNNAVKDGLKPQEVDVLLDGDAIHENFKRFTKKQLKEARLNKLIANSNKMTTKKNF